MGAITVSNVDWSIVQDVRDALAAATIASEAVFRVVGVSTSDDQTTQRQFHDTPVAVVRYVTTREDASPEDVRGCAAVLELTVAAAVNDAGADESDSLTEALRLKNAAVNAVEADPPAASGAWGDSDHYHPALRWGRPQIDASVKRPWVVCRLPLEVGFVLDDGASH